MDDGATAHETYVAAPNRAVEAADGTTFSIVSAPGPQPTSTAPCGAPTPAKPANANPGDRAQWARIFVAPFG